jgi:hypothetical protein
MRDYYIHSSLTAFKVTPCNVTLRQLDWSKFNANDYKKVDVILGPML